MYINIVYTLSKITRVIYNKKLIYCLKTNKKIIVKKYNFNYFIL